MSLLAGDVLQLLLDEPSSLLLQLTIFFRPLYYYFT